MRENIQNSRIEYEEIKAARLFTILFYAILITYDFLFYFIFAKTGGREVGLPANGMGVLYYILIGGLLPICIYIARHHSPYLVKYIYFVCFNLIDIVNNLMIYVGSDESFRSGNLVELFFILFTPVFINKKYFWTVFFGMISKYLFFGIIFKDTSVFVGIGLFILIASIAFVLLNRFTSYVRAITIAYEEMNEKEKLVTIGKMATAIGHEIKNPLAALRGFTQLQQETYPQQNKFYPIMIQEIDRINSIVNELMIIGKPRSIKLEACNLEEMLSYVISISTHQAESNNVLIELQLDTSADVINCDDKQLKQVFINVLKNAIESMPDGGKLTISSSLNKNKEVLLIFKDEGMGITKEDIKKLGQPFFTTKADGNGLGIMVSQHIVKQHEGTFEINSEVGKGTEIKISLPVQLGNY